MLPGFLRQGLWQKAYLLEFYKNEKEPTPSDSFTFGVPPESEEITLGMRKSEVKTFGGLVVDDYGCDNAVKILLTGSSVNNELRRIYRTDSSNGKPLNFMSGEEEIYTFKKFLEECKKQENLNGKMLMYDLSKYTNIVKSNSLIGPFCWRVYPGELKIKRSKEKPFTYTYSIEFTAIPEDRKPTVEYLLPELSSIDKIIDKIEKLLAEIKAKILYGRYGIKVATDKLKKVIDVINDYRRIVQASKDFVTGIIKTAVEGGMEVFNLVCEISNTSISLYKETVGSILPYAAEIYDYLTIRLVDGVVEVIDVLNNIYAPFKFIEGYAKGTDADWSFYGDVNAFVKSSYLVKDRVLDAWDSRMLGIYKETMHLSLMTKKIAPTEIKISTSNETSTKGNVGDAVTPTSIQNGVNQNKNTEDTVTAYGFKTELITDGSSFEHIAIANYGDVNKAELIASVNGASNIEELITSGKTVVIVPILEKKDIIAGNLIIGFSGQRDVYGVDIALDEQGNMNFDESGFEFKLVRGKENLSQAILNRLRESLNKRIMLQYYGIRITLPDAPAVSNAYIFLSIVQTLKMEARIKEILRLYFKIDGDVLRIDIDYTDIAGEFNNLQGVI